jgi:hypothetical protein
MARSGAKPGRLPESDLAIQIDTTQFRLGTRASHGLRRFIRSFNRTVVKKYANKALSDCVVLVALGVLSVA